MQTLLLLKVEIKNEDGCNELNSCFVGKHYSNVSR